MDSQHKWHTVQVPGLPEVVPEPIVWRLLLISAGDKSAGLMLKAASSGGLAAATSVPAAADGHELTDLQRNSQTSSAKLGTLQATASMSSTLLGTKPSTCLHVLADDRGCADRRSKGA